MTAPDIREIPNGLTCLLAADDLTGACDAAVQFAARGLRAAVRLDWDSAAPLSSSGGCDALALSTESRGMGRRELEHLWGGFPACSPAHILFKKIDSTLRGSVGLELALAANAFGAEAVLITPAFPAMGRRVESGRLRVDAPGFEPVEMAAYWEAQELRECAHVGTGAVAAALAAPIASGARFISVDACCDSDLDAIAAAGLACGRRLLWAGSAGLAAALGRALRPGPPPTPEPPARAAAVLFCIGSDHPVTIEQERGLAAARSTLALAPDEAAPEQIRETLLHGVHVMLRIPYQQAPPGRIRELIGGVRAPLVLSGGDTASLVCRALGVREIRLQSEIAPGIPRGIIAGGLLDAASVATKSGGFGAPDALIRIADCFTCLTP